MHVACSIQARCAFWRDKGYCDVDNVYFNYMKVNCKFACDLCLRAAKDGFAAEEEEFESRPHCIPLVKYQLPPPACDPSGHGLSCCAPTMCLPTDDSNSVFRCMVPLTIRGGAEGDTCKNIRKSPCSCEPLPTHAHTLTHTIPHTHTHTPLQTHIHTDHCAHTHTPMHTHRVHTSGTLQDQTNEFEQVKISQNIDYVQLTLKPLILKRAPPHF